MKAFLALVAFEIRERRAMIAAAAIASLLPLLAPLLPSTGSNPPEVIREAVMWVVLGGLAPLFALLLGIGFIGRDLSEGRLGFFFAQPVSEPVIWFGRLTAVIVLLWAVELVIMAPTVVLSPDPVQFFYLANVLDPFVPKWVVPTLSWVLSVMVVLLAHVVGIIWRARTVWIVLDFLALLFVIAVAWMSLRPFLPALAAGVSGIGIAWLAGWLLVGLVAAGAVQLSSGRVDLGRGHRAMSITLWTVIGGAVVILAVWSHWIRSAEPQDLDGVSTILVGSGEWVGISGWSSGRFDYLPQFLVNIEDGRWIPISGVRTWYGPYVRFSPDGRRAFWLATEDGDEKRLWFADLAASEVLPKRTEIVTRNDRNAFRASSNGRRVAFISDQTVTAYDVDQEKLIMVARFDEPFSPYRLRFDSANELSVMASSSWKRGEGNRNKFFTIDLTRRKIIEGYEVESAWSWWDERWTIREDRKFERIDEGEWSRLVLVDTETGEQIADLGTMKSWDEARTVSGERIVRFSENDGQRLLRVFDFDGRLVNEYPVGRSKHMYEGGEPRPGLLMIGHYNYFMTEGARGVDYLSSVVDLDTGEVVRIFTDQTPVLGTWGTWSSAGAWTPGSIATRLLHGEDGTLHLWDPETDKLEQIIPIPE